jgi:hypothetical protein
MIGFITNRFATHNGCNAGLAACLVVARAPSETKEISPALKLQARRGASRRTHRPDRAPRLSLASGFYCGLPQTSFLSKSRDFLILHVAITDYEVAYLAERLELTCGR